MTRALPASWCAAATLLATFAVMASVGTPPLAAQDSTAQDSTAQDSTDHDAGAPPVGPQTPPPGSSMDPAPVPPPPPPGAPEARSSSGASPAAPTRIADNDRATLHFELAEAHFAAERYDRALVELQTVREITGSDEVLYNMARCYQAMGRFEPALRDYDRFIAANITGPLRRDATRRAAELREHLEEERAAGRGGPGVGTYIGLAVGGAGLLVGAIFGALTLVEDGKLMDGCGATGSCSGEELSAIRTYRSVADVAFMAAAIGGTAGVIALILWALDTDGDEDDGADEEGRDDAPVSATVTPYVLPGQGAGASATVRF